MGHDATFGDQAGDPSRLTVTSITRERSRQAGGYLARADLDGDDPLAIGDERCRLNEHADHQRAGCDVHARVLVHDAGDVVGATVGTDGVDIDGDDAESLAATSSPAGMSRTTCSTSVL